MATMKGNGPPKFLMGLIKVLGGPLAKGIVQAIVGTWLKGGPVGAACFGLAKLARHMAARCLELAVDPRTDATEDQRLRMAQVHFDSAAELLKAVQADMEKQA